MTVKPGAIRFNTDSMKLEIFRGADVGIGTLAAGQWEEIQATSPDVQTGGTRGVMMGGRTPTNLDEIDYINIPTTGNSVNFGTLVTASQGVSLAVKQLHLELEDLLWGGSPTSQIDSSNYYCINWICNRAL